MVTKRRPRDPLERKHALRFAKQAGFGISGALNGALTAAYLANAGVYFLDPAGMAAAFMIFGWIGGFVGADVETPVAPLRKGTHTSERLSAAGTLVANSTTLIAAWLLLADFQSTSLWVTVIAFWWLTGVTLQIAAGALGRLRAVDPGIDAPPPLL